MKKIIILLIALTLCCAALTACDFFNKKTDGENVDISGVIFDSKTVTYDGTEKNIFAQNLPSGVTAQYVGNGKINAGKYTVTAKLYLNGEYIEGADKTATLTVNKAKHDMSGISFGDKEVTYDGNEYSIEIEGSLPKGVEVSYHGNGKTTAGEYTVKAVFDCGNENYEPIADMTATLKINKAKYDLSKITFDNTTVMYSREAYSILISGELPEGVGVSYTGNGQTEVGTYTVTATFSGDSENYEPIPDMTATLKIEPFSVDGISFSDKEIGYDGTPKSIYIDGVVPSDVEIIYDGNEKTEIGSYTVTVKFVTENKNYGEFPILTATMTIVKGTYVPVFNNTQLDFDGKSHSIAIEGAIPEGISVSYLNNGVTAPGTHTVTAVFTVDETKYNTIPNAFATITVILSDYKTPESDFEYSEKADGTVRITGYKGANPGVVIPDTINGKTVTSIATESFKDNKIITYVYISDKITNIGNNAFQDSSLQSIRFGNNVSVIGVSAFKGTKLECVTLPEKLTSIGVGAFMDTPMKEMAIPFIGGSHTSSNKFIGYVFGAKSHVANAEYVPETLTKVTLLDSCLSIPAYAFYGCEGLCEVVIGNGVKSIGNSAFAGCKGIRSLYVPESVDSIYADAYVYNSPFYNGSDELLVVFEADGVNVLGQYALFISETKKAISIYEKTYSDYLVNKDGSYREFDATDSKLVGIRINGSPVANFSSDKYDYSVTLNVTEGIKIVPTLSSFGATFVIVNPTLANENVATVRVTGADGISVTEYRIKLDFKGSATAEIVNKNGTDATVTFVIDDGHQGTASFAKTMILKYSNLSLSYAVKTKDLATLKTADSDGDGIPEYVMVNGKYTYEINQTNYSFWQDVLSAGRSEIVSHTHTHTFWGTDDEGGTYEYVKNATPNVISVSGIMPKGNSTKELYAAKQILEDMFGEYISKNGTAISLIDAGISVKTSDVVIDGKTITTYKKYFKELWKKAYNEGNLVSIRGTFGQNYNPDLDLSTKVVIPSKFDTYNERIAAPGYMVEHYNANPEGVVNDDISNWTDYIDAAISLNGWAGFCIHNIYEKESSSGHNITYAQAEKLFKYAAEKNIWVATYTAASLYYSEWSTAKTSAVYQNGNIMVSLTDEERNDIYNEALTVKVSVPATWESAMANGTALEIHKNTDGSSYVYVNVIPDTGMVTVIGS